MRRSTERRSEQNSELRKCMTEAASQVQLKMGLTQMQFWIQNHSSFEEVLPFGQGGIESLPGDYKGGRRSPLSCPLVA